MIKLNEEQMQFLSQFEKNMTTAVHSDWSSPIPSSAFIRMTEIFNAVTGHNRAAHPNCASCILETMTDIGRIYFANKEEASKHIVASTEETPKIVRSKIRINSKK